MDQTNSVENKSELESFTEDLDHKLEAIENRYTDEGLESLSGSEIDAKVDTALQVLDRCISFCEGFKTAPETSVELSERDKEVNEILTQRLGRITECLVKMDSQGLRFPSEKSNAVRQMLNKSIGLISQEQLDHLITFYNYQQFLDLVKPEGFIDFFLHQPPKLSPEHQQKLKDSLIIFAGKFIKTDPKILNRDSEYDVSGAMIKEITNTLQIQANPDGMPVEILNEVEIVNIKRNLQTEKKLGEQKKALGDQSRFSRKRNKEIESVQTQINDLVVQCTESFSNILNSSNVGQINQAVRTLAKGNGHFSYNDLTLILNDIGENRFKIIYSKEDLDSIVLLSEKLGRGDIAAKARLRLHNGFTTTFPSSMTPTGIPTSQLQQQQSIQPQVEQPKTPEQKRNRVTQAVRNITRLTYSHSQDQERVKTFASELKDVFGVSGVATDSAAINKSINIWQNKDGTVELETPRLYTEMTTGIPENQYPVIVAPIVDFEAVRDLDQQDNKVKNVEVKNLRAARFSAEGQLESFDSMGLPAIHISEQVHIPKTDSNVALRTELGSNGRVKKITCLNDQGFKIQITETDGEILINQPFPSGVMSIEFDDEGLIIGLNQNQVAYIPGQDYFSQTEVANDQGGTYKYDLNNGQITKIEDINTQIDNEPVITAIELNEAETYQPISQEQFDAILAVITLGTPWTPSEGNKIYYNSKSDGYLLITGISVAEGKYFVQLDNASSTNNFRQALDAETLKKKLATIEQPDVQEKSADTQEIHSEVEPRIEHFALADFSTLEPTNEASVTLYLDRGEGVVPTFTLLNLERNPEGGITSLSVKAHDKESVTVFTDPDQITKFTALNFLIKKPEESNLNSETIEVETVTNEVNTTDEYIPIDDTTMNAVLEEITSKGGWVLGQNERELFAFDDQGVLSPVEAIVSVMEGAKYLVTFKGGQIEDTQLIDPKNLKSLIKVLNPNFNSQLQNVGSSTNPSDNGDADVTGEVEGDPMDEGTEDLAPKEERKEPWFTPDSNVTNALESLLSGTNNVVTGESSTVLDQPSTTASQTEGSQTEAISWFENVVPPNLTAQLNDMEGFDRVIQMLYDPSKVPVEKLEALKIVAQFLNMTDVLEQISKMQNVGQEINPETQLETAPVQGQLETTPDEVQVSDANVPGDNEANNLMGNPERDEILTEEAIGEILHAGTNGDNIRPAIFPPAGETLEQLNIIPSQDVVTLLQSIPAGQGELELNPEQQFYFQSANLSEPVNIVKIEHVLNSNGDTTSAVNLIDKEGKVVAVILSDELEGLQFLRPKPSSFSAENSAGGETESLVLPLELEPIPVEGLSDIWRSSGVLTNNDKVRKLNSPLAVEIDGVKVVYTYIINDNGKISLHNEPSTAWNQNQILPIDLQTQDQLFKISNGADQFKDNEGKYKATEIELELNPIQSLTRNRVRDAHLSNLYDEIEIARVSFNLDLNKSVKKDAALTVRENVLRHEIKKLSETEEGIREILEFVNKINGGSYSHLKPDIMKFAHHIADIKLQEIIITYCVEHPDLAGNVLPEWSPQSPWASLYKEVIMGRPDIDTFGIVLAKSIQGVSSQILNAKLYRSELDSESKDIIANIARDSQKVFSMLTSGQMNAQAITNILIYMLDNRLVGKTKLLKTLDINNDQNWDFNLKDKILELNASASEYSDLKDLINYLKTMEYSVLRRSGAKALLRKYPNFRNAAEREDIIKELEERLGQLNSQLEILKNSLPEITNFAN